VCYLCTSCVCIFIFADDILLVSPTLTGLQTAFNTCERELEKLQAYMRVNVCMCIRCEHQFDAPCVELMSIHGDTLKWVCKMSLPW